MSMTILEFQKALAEHGLVPESTLRQVLESWQGSPPQTAENLARELMRRQMITKFQAQVVHSGRGASLVLGNYVLLDKIGEGGMGLVYKAEHRRMKRVVALKVLPPEKIRDMAVARFERELQAAARLTHPHIITAHDADEVRGIYFYVMEYVDGCDLSSLVKKNGPLPVTTAVDYLRQASLGVAHAHQLGVIHRDIKPSNLLLDSTGTVKVLDLGIARLEDAIENSLTGLTATGMVMGTIDFMAPEQAVNAKRADARSDIYSLGCTLHYLLTGQVAYSTGTTMMERILAHREDPIPSLRVARADVPPLLDNLFQRMLQKRAEDRPANLHEVLQALDSVRVQPAAAMPPVPVTDVAAGARSGSTGAVRGGQTANANGSRARSFVGVPTAAGNPEAIPVVDFLDTRDQSRHEPHPATKSQPPRDTRTHSTLHARNDSTLERRRKPQPRKNRVLRLLFLSGFCLVATVGIAMMAMWDWPMIARSAIAWTESRPPAVPVKLPDYERKPEAPPAETPAETPADEKKPEAEPTNDRLPAEKVEEKPAEATEGPQEEMKPKAPPEAAVPPVDAPPVSPTTNSTPAPDAGDREARIARALAARRTALNPLQCLPGDGLIAGLNIAEALRLDPAQMSIDELYAQLPQASQALIDNLRNTANFCPLRDVRSVVFWIDGNIKPWGLLAIELKVAVNPADIATSLGSTLDEQDGMLVVRTQTNATESETSTKVELLFPAEKLMVLCFGDTEVSDRIQRIQTAIKDGGSISPQLRTRLQTLNSSPVWIHWTIDEVKRAMMLAALPQNLDDNEFMPPVREILPSIESLSLWLKRRNGVELVIEAIHHDESSATTTSTEFQESWGVVKALLTDEMLKELDPALKTGILELVSTVTIKSNGKAAQLALTMSDALLSKLKAMAQQQALLPPAAPPAPPAPTN